LKQVVHDFLEERYGLPEERAVLCVIMIFKFRKLHTTLKLLTIGHGTNFKYTVPTHENPKDTGKVDRHAVGTKQYFQLWLSTKRRRFSACFLHCKF